MKEIRLSQSKIALVDDEDFNELNKYKWCAHKNRRTFYAERNIQYCGKQKTIKMHHIIMGVKWIDHKDGNGLNNQKDNLRAANRSQNGMNMKKQSNTTSIYKGVYFYKRYDKWKSQIAISGKRIHLGYFDSEKAAALSYNSKAIELFKDFAKLNKL